MRRVLIWAVGLLVAGAAGVVTWFFVTTDVGAPTQVTAPPVDPTGEVGGEESLLLELATGTVASFEIDEELAGQPNHVVGSTEDVVGQIAVNLADLAQSEIGEILINARTFTTDEDLRNRAIRGPILDAETHEFIRFAPVRVEGLSGEAEIGREYSFEVSGDLTIRDVTRPVSFSVAATFVEPAQLEGTATAEVLRSDFELEIPSVPRVADVTDEVLLTLEFTAVGP